MKNQYILLIVVFALVLSLVGYFLYQNEDIAGGNTIQESLTQNSPVPTEVNEQTLETQEIPEFSSFMGFKVEYPKGWIYIESGENDLQPKYIFQKNEKELVFEQIQGGGQQCVTNSEEIDLNNPEFFQDLTGYETKTVESKVGNFLYFDDGNKIKFCGPVTEDPGKYFTISDIGAIEFNYGSTLEQSELEEIISIIRSTELI